MRGRPQRTSKLGDDSGDSPEAAWPEPGCPTGPLSLFLPATFPPPEPLTTGSLGSRIQCFVAGHGPGIRNRSSSVDDVPRAPRLVELRLL